MARDPFRLGLTLVLLLAACGGGGDAAEDTTPAVDTAKIRARRDSIQAVRRQADSIAQVTYAACGDSVVAQLRRTAAGRRKLAQAMPEGMVRPEVLAACGQPPTTTAVPPAQATAPPAASPAGDTAPTPVVSTARSDSAARAQARARQADSLERVRIETARQDSLARARETEVLRETFSYGGGSRDPFASLISADRVGPELADLQLVGVYQDLAYSRNSIAILREKAGSKRYKLRVGDQLGRLTVAQIRRRDVVFTIEDFGFERQETLSLPKREEESQ